MPQFVAGGVLHPRSPTGAVEDLVDPLRAQWQPATRTFEHHEHPVGSGVRRPLVVQVGAEGVEEPVRYRHHPVVAALALGDNQPMVGDLHVDQPQSKHLAAAQPGQQHRQHHGPVALRAQRSNEPIHLRWREDLRQRPGHAHQRHPGTAPALTSGRQPRGTGLQRTAVSPRAIAYAYNPDTDDNRRASVRADTPDSRSASRTTVRSPR